MEKETNNTAGLASSGVLEPNPGAGVVPLSNYLQVPLLLVNMPVIGVQVAGRRLFNFGSNKISFAKDLVLALVRSSLTLPLAIVRAGDQPKPEKVFSTPRFRSKSDNLWQRVLEPGVAGYWMCKGPPGQLVEPASCDLVLYYAHGGAYVSGSPFTHFLAILRIAEVAAERGLTVAAFGLEYSLAPEATFPKPVRQAVQGYKYLLDQGIDASKIAFFGESAGAHLHLSLLTVLEQEQLPKPGRGAFLQSPWVDLTCSNRPSYENNKLLDFLSRELVLGASSCIIGDKISEEAAPFIDFTKPLHDGRSWKDVLPSRVWLTAGTHELLLSEVTEFYAILKKDGVNVHLELEEGGIHVPHALKDVLDRNAYLSCTTDKLPEGLLVGTNLIANAILLGIDSL